MTSVNISPGISANDVLSFNDDDSIVIILIIAIIVSILKVIIVVVITIVVKRNGDGFSLIIKKRIPAGTPSWREVL